MLSCSGHYWERSFLLLTRILSTSSSGKMWDDLSKGFALKMSKYCLNNDGASFT